MAVVDFLFGHQLNHIHIPLTQTLFSFTAALHGVQKLWYYSYFAKNSFYVGKQELEAMFDFTFFQVNT